MVYERATTNAEAANLDQALKLPGWPDHDFVVHQCQMDAVVADQRCCVDQARPPGQDQIEGEA